ncbi:cell division protein FtsQ/DivIB [Antribacter gilvus]|uniref:cell division protein FtsQ/DivIB n=1 Tax=Antribacter gilvus TaxID=2304675 RepID=UPI001F0C63DD|nr:cell division protein FtsQ/DivIB [Antribacter gilvus]
MSEPPPAASAPEPCRDHGEPVHPAGSSTSGSGSGAGPVRPGVVSTRMADRRAERDAERAATARHRLLRRVLWGVLALVLVGAAGWVAFFSPVLALDAEQVVVRGEGATVDVAQVRDVVDDAAGVPLPRLDTVALRERILGLNGVKDVRLGRTWPDGLDVTLTARVPVAAVPAPGGYALLDDEGVQVGESPQPPDALPVVAVPIEEDGGTLALGAALRVLGALPPDLASQVASVTADTQDDVRTTLHDGVAVHWGNGERTALKVRVVQTLRAAAPEARILDVSSPELPVTR